MECGAVVIEERYIYGFRDGKQFEWPEIFCSFECYMVHCRKNNWEHLRQMAVEAKRKESLKEKE